MNTEPMLQFEQLLKEFFLLSGNSESHIFTASEMAEYLSWMSKTNQNRASTHNFRIENPDIPNTGLRILAESARQPNIVQEAADGIIDAYTNHSEGHFLIANHDISATRVFRYMPSCWHANDFFCIYYVFSGSGAIYFQNETVSMRPGSMVIVAPSVIHAYPRNKDDLVVFAYYIRSSTFENVFWNQLPQENLMTTFFQQALNSNSPSSYVYFETQNDADIEALLKTIYQETRNSAPYRVQFLNTLMSTFFVLLLRRYEGTARLPHTETLRWNHKFSAILTFIQNHFATASLPKIAKRFHYSERQIERIVHNCMGMRYSQLILKLRMEQAVVLLKQRNIPIESIASKVGYASASSFYRAFTKYYGCAPTSYLETKATLYSTIE